MEFRMPSFEKIKELEDALEHTDEQEEYWKDVQKRHQKLPKDTLTVAKFLKEVLEEVREKYPNTGILRIALFEYAKRLERLATYKMEDAEPKVRSDILLTAANLYQEGDELIGCLSDYFLERHMECVSGAIYFRKEAGLEDEIEELGLQERVKALTKAAFADGIYIVNKDDCKELLKNAEQIVDGVFGVKLD